MALLSEDKADTAGTQVGPDAFEQEVIEHFVEISRALGHPCKIYNALGVGAPLLYLGPSPSHLSDILKELGSSVCGQVRHGQVEQCEAEIRRIADQNQRGESGRYAAAAARFSQRTLLPQLVAILEQGTVRSGQS